MIIYDQVEVNHFVSRTDTSPQVGISHKSSLDVFRIFSGH